MLLRIPKNFFIVSGLTFFRSPNLTKVIKRNFNQATLNNAYRYLVDNKEKITFAKNESGFIRMQFPKWVLEPDKTIAPLESGDILRANYWYYTSTSDCGVGDESIHDHPRQFQSYIVHGGYEHELYELIDSANTNGKFNLPYLLSSEHLSDLYQLFCAKKSLPDMYGSNVFKFSIDKKNKSISYQGKFILKKTGIETTKQGDIVSIDTDMIHRVSKYHTVPNQKTLSLNIVRNKGKFVTNIYLPEKKIAAVKTERDSVTQEVAISACNEMITLFSKSKI